MCAGWFEFTGSLGNGHGLLVSVLQLRGSVSKGRLPGLVTDIS